MKTASTLAVILALFMFAGLAPAGTIEEAIEADSNGNYAQALELLKPLTAENDPAALYYLGLMTMNGRGMEPSDSGAITWYRQAAEQGYADAQLQLGFMLFQGRGCERNVELAVQWFQKAAAQGNLTAQNNLGAMNREGIGFAVNMAEAFKWFKGAAELGYPDSQYNLAEMYYLGQGVEKNPIAAAAWYRKAAEQGNPLAQNSLGWLYESGQGVEQNDAEALAWYRKSAAQGNLVAQTNIGNIYEDGKGVAKDPREAFAWYSKAAEQGYARGQHCLGMLYMKGSGVDRNPEKGVELLKLSADQGFAPAQVDLGFVYQCGDGVPQDPAEAMRLYRQAAKLGSQTALRVIPILEQTQQARAAHPDSPNLFGVSLAGAHRDEMRKALMAAGLKALRENYDYFADKYDPSTVIPAADEMLVFYSQESDVNGWGSTDYLAKVSYRFPSSRDPQQVVGIRDLVGSKYGNPDLSSGSPKSGPVSYTWKRDGVDIVVQRDWPETTTYLVYLVPEIKQAMDAELAALEK